MPCNASSRSCAPPPSASATSSPHRLPRRIPGARPWPRTTRRRRTARPSRGLRALPAGRRGALLELHPAWKLRLFGRRQSRLGLAALLQLVDRAAEIEDTGLAAL